MLLLGEPNSALRITGLVAGDPKKPIGAVIEAVVSSGNPETAMKEIIPKDVFANKQVHFQKDGSMWREKFRSLLLGSSTVQDSVLWEKGDSRENCNYTLHDEVKKVLGEFGTRGTNHGLKCVLLWLAVLEWGDEELERRWTEFQKVQDDHPSWKESEAFIKMTRASIKSTMDDMVDGIDIALRDKVGKAIAQTPRTKKTASADTSATPADPCAAAGVEIELTHEEDTNQDATAGNKTGWNRSHADGLVPLLDKGEPLAPLDLFAIIAEYGLIGKCLAEMSYQSNKFVVDWTDKNNLKTADDNPDSYEPSKQVLEMYKNVPEVLKEVKIVRSVYAAARQCAKKTRPLYVEKDLEFYNDELLDQDPPYQQDRKRMRRPPTSSPCADDSSDEE
jgi:hypothetical protein